ncbi:pyridoxal kinase PdxY [Azospirillum canadense]|uniref:pyridoxal kinase PdxY n=1 Tax=Azospirillum canadense TaxID=403962 RepID=UPI002226BC36|nr:pyridoxal kinase PdxY [Azospirillum canadense]MCW2236013.1 pyridoxine kinase [Azospirillum canadense]
MKTVISIQSHVAYGYVGNRAAVFPLQRLGIDAIAVNTVQFSNHTGYGEWTGQVFSAEHIADVLDGIAARGVLPKCHALLSGYMGDVGLGQVIVETAARLKAANPRAVYACDPVMGDVGRGFFVRPGLPEFIKEHAVPAADLLTPNQFELEYLADRKVETLEDALTATAALRARGPRLVLVTSLTRRDAAPDSIEMLADNTDGAWLVSTPRLPLEPPPNGSGDAVAALFLAHYLKNYDPAHALEQAAAAIYAIFLTTRRLGTRELALVAAQDEFVSPSCQFRVTRVR